MDHYQRIYRQQASDYQRMIAAEDVDGNLLSALQEIIPFEGKRLLDLGTGTGRLPLLVSEITGRVIGMDLQRAMLRENRMQRERTGRHWDLIQGDMRFLPFSKNWADVTAACWAIGHMRSWFSDDWREQVRIVLCEMQRVTRPGGFLIILETLGTGSLQPAPPVKGLAQYYTWLETHWGFERREIRTDYQFSSVEEAITNLEFFFGSELAARIHQYGWSRVPEWTGIWFKRV